MSTTNISSLFGVPEALNKRMVVIKPTRLSDGHVVKTWYEAISHLVDRFWGAGANCSFVLEAKAVLNDHVYDAVVEIRPDGSFAVRRI